ncbi:MAG: endonuclease/exonuclease/phosphatase family protein [Bacteroidetes bacterium]|nr:endonuclease/exonuclease/phosphatase family protein [Bacteroidota bacterium]
MTRLFPLLFLVIIVAFVYGQKFKQPLKVVFYNVENLFDTIDDKHKNDNEFLPGSKKNWDSEKYIQKIRNLGHVLYSIDNAELPAIIGFCEVENREVLEDLIRFSPLAGSPYEIILEEGSDPRGIDVALIFRSDRFSCLSHQAISSSNHSRSRHILYVKLLGPAEDTLHLFVNHWKSRFGGEKKTRPKRMENAILLREVIDSLFALDTKTNILIMGDMNDEPDDESIILGLEALPITKKPETGELYNLFYRSFKEGEGTIWYKDWDLFDQIIVSGNLLITKRKNRPHIDSPYGFIMNKHWMLYKNNFGENIPLRSYRGGKYLKGYSDHLPVYTILSY